MVEISPIVEMTFNSVVFTQALRTSCRGNETSLEFDIVLKK